MGAVLELKFRTGKKVYNRRNCLSKEHETELALSEESHLRRRVLWVIDQLSKYSSLDRGSHPHYRMANSLFWVWAQRNSETIRSNLRILMAAKGVTSLELATRMGAHRSKVDRMIRMRSAADFAHWNFENAYNMAKELESRLDVLLLADLKAMIKAVSNTK